MRIQPISNNNAGNTNFKKIKIYQPKEWDVEVMEAVVNNQSIKDFAKHLDEKGQDLVIYSYMKPIPMIMVELKGKWHQLLGDYSKQSILEGLVNFNYKDFLAKQEAEEQAIISSQSKRDEILARVDEFNKQLKFEPVEHKIVEQPIEQPKKRTFFQRLFGLNK